MTLGGGSAAPLGRGLGADGLQARAALKRNKKGTGDVIRSPGASANV